MPFIGNQPAEKYSAFTKQDFSTSATTSYTLSQAVANENEIALFINFVRQEPTTAYTASGTSLTLTSATSSSDDMYCVYLGKAVQTVNPPSGSVGSSQVAASIITGQTAETSIATDDTVLIHDTSAGALRKMTRANFVSGVGGDFTPNFLIYQSSNQDVGSGSDTRVVFDTEVYDSDNAFTNTSGNYKFTVPSGEGGKYVLYFSIRKNNFTGNRTRAEIIRTRSSSESSLLISETNGGSDAYDTLKGFIVTDCNALDEFHMMFLHSDSGTRSIFAGQSSTFFGGYKLI